MSCEHYKNCGPRKTHQLKGCMGKKCIPESEQSASAPVESPSAGCVFAMLDESALKLDEASKLLKEGDTKGSALLIDEHLKMNREAKELWEKQNRGIGGKSPSIPHH